MILCPYMYVLLWFSPSDIADAYVFVFCFWFNWIKFYFIYVFGTVCYLKFICIIVAMVILSHNIFITIILHSYVCGYSICNNSNVNLWFVLMIWLFVVNRYCCCLLLYFQFTIRTSKINYVWHIKDPRTRHGLFHLQLVLQ